MRMQPLPEKVRAFVTHRELGIRVQQYVVRAMLSLAGKERKARRLDVLPADGGATREIVRCGIDLSQQHGLLERGPVH